MVDLFLKGIAVKFGCAHDLSGNLHQLRLSDSLDATVGLAATGTAPVGHFAGLTCFAVLGLSPTGIAAAATYDSCGEGGILIARCHVLSNPRTLAVFVLVHPAVLSSDRFPFFTGNGAVIEVEL